MTNTVKRTIVMVLLCAGIGTIGGSLLQRKVHLASEKLEKETFTFLAIQRRDLLLNSFFDSLGDLRMLGRFYQNSDFVEVREFDSFISSLLEDKEGIQYSVLDIESQEIVQGSIEKVFYEAALKLLKNNSIEQDSMVGMLVTDKNGSTVTKLLLFLVIIKSGSDEQYAIIMKMDPRNLMESIIDPEAVLGLPASLFILNPARELIYYHKPRLDWIQGKELNTAEEKPYFRYSYLFTAADLDFELHIDASPAYRQKHRRSLNTLILPTSMLSGILLGLVIAWFINMIIQSKTQLAMAEKRFEQFFNLNPDMLAILNEDAVFIYINKSWTEQFSYNSDVLLGHCIFDFLDATDIPAVKKALASIIDTKMISSFIAHFKNQAGSYLDVEWHAVYDHSCIYLGGRDISVRIQYEKELESALEDKETLLREVHHRVKNNLQIIASILNLQQHESTDSRLASILNRAQNRIRSMALVHESLYRSDDLSSIDFAAYADTLLSCFLSTDDGKSVQIVMNSDPLYFSLDMTIHFGLLLNELATNALKYAFKNCPEPRIDISIQEKPGSRLLFCFEDNGVGLPSDFTPGTHGHLGMRLVEALASQMSNEDMNLEYSSGNSGTGTKIVIDLKPTPNSYSRRNPDKNV